MDTYKFEVSVTQYCTLFLALGYASGAAMKDQNPSLAQDIHDVALNMSKQALAQEKK
jgi:hypothetical protein